MSDTISIKDSKAVWVCNCNMHQWDLVKKVFVPGKNWLNDKNVTRNYGSVELVEHGKHQGKYEASIPMLSDEPEDWDKDVDIIGCYDTAELARKAVMEANNPDYSCNYI